MSENEPLIQGSGSICCVILSEAKNLSGFETLRRAQGDKLRQVPKPSLFLSAEKSYNAWLAWRELNIELFLTVSPEEIMAKTQRIMAKTQRKLKKANHGRRPASAKARKEKRRRIKT